MPAGRQGPGASHDPGAVEVDGDRALVQAGRIPDFGLGSASSWRFAFLARPGMRHPVTLESHGRKMASGSEHRDVYAVNFSRRESQRRPEIPCRGLDGDRLTPRLSHSAITGLEFGSVVGELDFADRAGCTGLGNSPDRGRSASHGKRASPCQPVDSDKTKPMKEHKSHVNNSFSRRGEL